MSDNAKVITFLVVAFVLVGLAIGWELSLWNECRETNSFWYCVRVIGK